MNEKNIVYYVKFYGNRCVDWFFSQEEAEEFIEWYFQKYGLRCYIEVW